MCICWYTNANGSETILTSWIEELLLFIIIVIKRSYQKELSSIKRWKSFQQRRVVGRIKVEYKIHLKVWQQSCFWLICMMIISSMWLERIWFHWKSVLSADVKCQIQVSFFLFFHLRENDEELTQHKSIKVIVY